MLGLSPRSLLIIRSQAIKRSFCNKVPKVERMRSERLELKLFKIKDFVIQENIETNGNIDWNKLVTQLTEQRLVNKINFEMDLMSAFLVTNQTNGKQMDEKLFQSIVKFIKVLPNVRNNSIAVSRYCHFISHFHQYIDDSDKELIRRTTDQMMTKYIDNRLTTEILKPSLISLSKSSANNCLHSIKLLDQMKQKDYTLIQQIIDSTLDFKLIDQSLNLIKKYSDITLNDKMVTKIINALYDCNHLTLNQILEILNYFSDSLTIFDTSLKPQIIEILKRFSYQIFDTSVQTNGLCLKCDHRLREVTAEEQNRLKNDFYSVVFNKSNDLLMKSFPKFQRELKNFDIFMDKITKTKPLDLVIDGLNIAFTTSSMIVEDKKKLRKFIHRYPIQSIDHNLVEILSTNNIKKYQNVLIVGRNHMKNWNKLNQLLTTQKQRISLFYTTNKTQDDCYILYASLQNPNSFLISNDLYRDFREKMSQKGNLFERWLTTHQILFPLKERHFIFSDRFEHRINISFDKTVIHIPFSSDENSKINWICGQNYNLVNN